MSPFPTKKNSLFPTIPDAPSIMKARFKNGTEEKIEI